MSVHTSISSLLLVIIGTLGIFQPGTVMGTEHQCTCEYNSQYPDGHCTCNPPLPGAGDDGGYSTLPIPNAAGQRPGGASGSGGSTGPVQCTCVVNDQYPQGQCTCDKELCFPDQNGNTICVQG